MTPPASSGPPDLTRQLKDEMRRRSTPDQGLDEVVLMPVNGLGAEAVVAETEAEAVAGFAPVDTGAGGGAGAAGR